MGSDPSPVPTYVAWMRIIVSLVALLSAILILTAPNFVFAHAMDDGIQKLAAAWIGAVIGYWLS